MKTERSKDCINGEIVTFKQNQMLYEICCDCLLAHYVAYWIEKGTVKKQVFRDDFRTIQERKKMGIKVIKMRKKK